MKNKQKMFWNKRMTTMLASEFQTVLVKIPTQRASIIKIQKTFHEKAWLELLNQLTINYWQQL